MNLMEIQVTLQDIELFQKITKRFIILQKEEVESVCLLSIDEIKSLMQEGKFFENHYEEFEILLDWLE